MFAGTDGVIEKVTGQSPMRQQPGGGPVPPETTVDHRVGPARGLQPN